MKKVDGKATFNRLVSKVRNTNSTEWEKKPANLHNRFRGNCWTVLRRLCADYKNHFGNHQRADKQQMPYVVGSWLFTSPALISHAEGKSMDNSTVNRWLDVLHTDEKKMVAGKPFILKIDRVSPKKVALMLNADFFEYMDIELPNIDRPPDDASGHIELSKLAKKFNRKHHIR